MSSTVNTTTTATEDGPLLHEQFAGLGSVFTAEQKRTISAVGHLAAGFLTLLVVAPLGAALDLNVTDDAAPDGGGADGGPGMTSPEKVLAVTDTAVRGFAMVIALTGDPSPAGDPGLAWLRRLTATFGVVNKAASITTGWGSGAALAGRREAVLDAITAVAALFPAGKSVAELAAQPDSPSRTVAILDEACGFGEIAVAFLHLRAQTNPDPDSRAVMVAVKTVLVVGVGGLHITQGMLALNPPK